MPCWYAGLPEEKKIVKKSLIFFHFLSHLKALEGGGGAALLVVNTQTGVCGGLCGGDG